MSASTLDAQAGKKEKDMNANDRYGDRVCIISEDVTTKYE